MSKASDLASAVNKALGIDTIRMGNDPMFEARYIPTGILPIDLMFGGGLPRNRIVQLYGGYSTLKSFIAYKAIASCQRNRGICALVDTEHVWDDPWAAALGVNTNDVLMVPTDTAEEALDISEAFIRQGVDLLVWDSVAATLPQEEAGKRMHKEGPPRARQASFMSAGLRKITAANRSTAILFCNQTRINAGMTFGNPETIPGGKALPFYATYQVRMSRVGKTESARTYYHNGLAEKGKQIDAVKIKASLEKSKLNRGPGREFTFDFDLVNACIDEVGFLVSFAMELGLVINKGTSWSIKGSKQTPIKGREKFIAWLRGNAAAQAILTARVTQSFSPGSLAPVNNKADKPKLVLRVKKA